MTDLHRHRDFGDTRNKTTTEILAILEIKQLIKRGEKCLGFKCLGFKFLGFKFLGLKISGIQVSGIQVSGIQVFAVKNHSENKK